MVNENPIECSWFYEAYPPRVTEIDFVKPHEYHSHPAGGLVRLPARVILSIETRHDEMANAHPDGSSDEHWLAPKLINV